MEIFAQRLKQLRKSKNITLEEIEKATKIPTGTLSRYELNQREPKITYAKRLADYFKVDPAWLVGWKD